MATRGTGADLSRNPDLAGQTVKQGDYSLTYDDNGYAVKSVNTKHEIFSGRDDSGSSGGSRVAGSTVTLGAVVLASLIFDLSFWRILQPLPSSHLSSCRGVKGLSTFFLPCIHLGR